MVVTFHIILFNSNASPYTAHRRLYTIVDPATYAHMRPVVDSGILDYALLRSMALCVCGDVLGGL